MRSILRDLGGACSSALSRESGEEPWGATKVPMEENGGREGGLEAWRQPLDGFRVRLPDSCSSQYECPMEQRTTQGK